MPESKSGALPLGDSPAEPRLSRECVKRMSRERSNEAALHGRGQPCQRLRGLPLAGEGGEHGGAGARHARAVEPLERVLHFRKFRGGDGGEIVAAVTLGKDVYFRRWRV